MQKERILEEVIGQKSLAIIYWVGFWAAFSKSTEKTKLVQG